MRGRDKSFLPSSHVVEKCVRTFHDVIARKAFPFNIPEGDEREKGRQFLNTADIAKCFCIFQSNSKGMEFTLL